MSRWLSQVLFGVALTIGVAPARAETRLVSTETGYRLEVDGHPFFIKGAGGDGPKQLLRDIGGNAFRTWGADHIEKQLDEAQRLGLKVLVGIWLGHERHGFNYSDPAQVTAQEEK